MKLGEDIIGTSGIAPFFQRSATRADWAERTGKPARANGVRTLVAVLVGVSQKEAPVTSGTLGA